MIRAIHTTELNFDTCAVYELDSSTNQFFMLSNPEITHSAEFVFDNEGFLVFLVTEDDARPLTLG